MKIGTGIAFAGISIALAATCATTEGAALIRDHALAVWLSVFPLMSLMFLFG